MSDFATRPVVMGRKAVVTSGHYLATAAGFRVMEAGGNAIDAAAAMCFCLNLLEPQSNGIGGEVPTLIYSAKEQRCYALSGVGWSPKALTIEWFRKADIDLIPGDGFLPVTVPAVVDSWALALSRFGTMGFSQVLAPALELAQEGFPMYPGLHASLSKMVEKFQERYPTSAEVYCPGGKVVEPGALFRNPDFAEMLRIMCRAEAGAKHKGRTAGLQAARDAFYEGEIADRILAFATTTLVPDASGTQHSSPLVAEDLAQWRATLEEPAGLDVYGTRVHKCPAWTQGPVFLQQLSLLTGFDLSAMGHNSEEYLHTVIECAKLAFADREAYYGDPLFDDVPLDRLLSEEYAAQRRALVGTEASGDFVAGDLATGSHALLLGDVAADNRRALNVAAGARQDIGTSHSHMGDTTHLDAIDAEGNMVAATPSGGWVGTSPLIPGLGFPLGTRGQMFYLNPKRPNALAPHKRPRATLTPSLVTRKGKPWLVFGTPGGDSQDQWTLQFFLNHVVFGMDLQVALDAPTVNSVHFPSSFYPRDSYPRRFDAEDRIPAQVLEGLRKRGHKIQLSGPWSHGKALAVSLDLDTGVISGAASPRTRIGYAFGW